MEGGCVRAQEQPAARAQAFACPERARCSLTSRGAVALGKVFQCRQLSPVHLSPACLWGCFNPIQAQEEL